MRWSIIRTIWLREMRDQLRDRRTIFMIVALPLLLYPVLGVIVLQLVVAFGSNPSTIGVVTGAPDHKDFPPRDPPGIGLTPLPTLAWLAATPLIGTDTTQWAGAAALSHADHQTFDYPFLIQEGRFTTFDRRMSRHESRKSAEQALIKLVFLKAADEKLLEDGKLDLVIDIPADFFARLEKGDEFAAADPPLIELRGRKGDSRSRLAKTRVMRLMELWRQDLKKTRLARKGISDHFLDPFAVKQPEATESAGGGGGGNVGDLVVRIFPFMLVMWSLAGALYPAVDLCAGEKERGTMETLLITPAGREEIVMGKFLTIWVFSSATALLNLFSMGIATTLFADHLPHGGISIPALLWCVVLLLPQSAFFSAISLAIGAYARSSKEGQYYLMPLFLVTMPLIFLTLAPGIELNALYSMVPVTGVALLMQRLMTASTLADIPWIYFGPVLAPMALYSWLSLRWAIEQFNREDVLFREAERIDVLLWLKSLFHDKAALPTTAEAFFCLGVLIGLRWLSMGLRVSPVMSPEMLTAICQLAFVAMPAIFMVLLLNTQPSEALWLRRPNLHEAGLAALLALLLLPPMAGLAQAAATWYPHLLQADSKHPLIGILNAINKGQDLAPAELLTYLLAFAVIPAICEEMAFRGYVLRGLHAHYRPRNAILLGAFFFALFHMNVFLFLPTFILGVVLGLLTVRSRSLLPAILFHLLHNSVLIALIPLRHWSDEAWFLQPAWLTVIATCVIATIAIVWRLYRKPYVDLARREVEEAQARSQLPVGGSSGSE